MALVPPSRASGNNNNTRLSAATMASSAAISDAEGDALSPEARVTKQEAAHNVLVAITLQIRARAEELCSGRAPLVLSEKVIHLIEKTRSRYYRSLEQQQQQQAAAAAASSGGGGGAQQQEVRKYVPPAISKALLDELKKISFLVVLGRIRGATFAEQVKQEEDQLRRAANQRRRAQDQLLGGMAATASSAMGNISGDLTHVQHGGAAGGPSGVGRSLSFLAFPSLVNVAFCGCHIRRIDGLSRVAKFIAMDTEVPQTAAMPLLSVFAALRHVEFDLELGMISPVVEQLSSFTFSLRSVSITINETPGVNEHSGGGRSHNHNATNAAATAVTMNRRLFADVWRPKGAQIKILGATQKSQKGGGGSGGGNGDNDKDGGTGGGGAGENKDGSLHGFWEALTSVKIRGDLCRRREGRTMAVLMLDDSWRGLKHVTTLTLRGLRFTSFAELITLQGMVHLREIDLGDNCISSLAGAHESLPKQNLRTLCIDANRISGGLAEICQLPITSLNLSVNNISEWSELTPLCASKTLRMLDVRANSLDARAPHERDAVINAEDLVSVILRVMNNPLTIVNVNGFDITNTLRSAADTERIRKNVDAILAQEKVNAANALKYPSATSGNNDDDQAGPTSPTLRSSGGGGQQQQLYHHHGGGADLESNAGGASAAAQSTHGGGGKRRRVVVKGVPTRIVQLSEGKQPGGGGGGGKSGAAASGAGAGDASGGVTSPAGMLLGKKAGAAGMTQTGLDYLRATFGDQYLLHLPQAEFPEYVDPNDPNPTARGPLSYEQAKNDIGVAGLLGVDSKHGGAAGGASADGANAGEGGKPGAGGVTQLKRTLLTVPVQPVLDQFLSEIRRHDWYPSGSTEGGSRTKVFPLGCEMMFSTITFENACFWEVPLFPPAKQTSNQPYAVSADGREICLANGSEKNSKVNDTHMRFARKVLFRIVETHVGFTRHIRLEERNLSGVPIAFFQNSPKKLAELAGPQSGVIREKPPRLAKLGENVYGVSSEQLESIPSFSGRYPIFSCVLPSDEHTPPLQINAKFFSVANARAGDVPVEHATSPVSSATFDGKGSSPSGSPSGKGGGRALPVMGIDEMAELSRHRVFGTGETQLLAGFVVPARIAAEFKRRLVSQLKTAAAKLSIQGVFREWPFIVRGEGSGEQRDASVPIEPTGKYLHDRLTQTSPEPESLARQRINNDVGVGDQELSLRLRRFVFETKRKFSTEPIPEFDFLSYFNALSPDAMMWQPQLERSLIVGCAGSSLFVAENVDTVDHATGDSKVSSPEEHFTHPRRYELINLRAIVCSFDLCTIRLHFAAADRRLRDLQLLSREPRISLQFLATLVRLRFLPDSPALVGPITDLPKIVANLMDTTTRHDAPAQIFFRPTNIGRFTTAPFIFVAHVFFKTSEGPESKKLSIVNPAVYPMRCIHAIHCGWACARLVITSKDMRLVEVREMVSVDPADMMNRGKKSLEEPHSVDVQQPSQLLRLELSPASVFPLLFSLVFSCPSAPSKEAVWTLCAPHPATLFAIRRELRNVQRQLQISEMDLEAVDEQRGFPPPLDKTTTTTGGGGSGQLPAGSPTTSFSQKSSPGKSSSSMMGGRAASM